MERLGAVLDRAAKAERKGRNGRNVHKPEQPVLPAPEFQPPAGWEKIEAAAKRYQGLVRDRIAIQAEEKSAYELVEAHMKAAGITSYQFHGFEIVRTEPKFKVKIDGAEEEADGQTTTEAAQEPEEDFECPLCPAPDYRECDCPRQAVYNKLIELGRGKPVEPAQEPPAETQVAT